MDTFLSVLGTVFLCGWLIAGVVCFAGDARMFSGIVAQCKAQGYIQDNKTRIMCQVEEVKK